MKKIKVLVYIFFIFMTHIGRQIEVSATNYCNADIICNETIAHEYAYYSHVCKPCFCSGECSTETVCPEFDSIDASYEECRHQLSFLNEWDLSQYKLPEDLHTSYFVVVRCPPDADKELKADCESKNNTEDKLYVSSVLTYRIYKNKYCAQCNGENNYVNWTKTIGVSEDYLMSIISQVNTKPELITHMIEMYSFSIPPHGYPDFTNVCGEEDIKLCNVTGDWVKYDINLVKLCGSSKFPSMSFKGTNYRNVYCILCNQIDYCMTPVERFNPRAPNILRLLQWDDNLVASFKNRGRDESVHACRNNQVVDPFQGGCINVTCPIGHISINGICENEGTLLGGTTIYFPLTFRLFQPSLLHRDHLYKWTENQFRKGECNFCLNSRCFDSLCSFYGTFTLNKECNITRLISVFQELEYTFLRQKEFEVHGFTAFNATFEKKIILSMPTDTECPSDIELWQKYHCSSILMTSDILSKLERLGLSDEIYNVSEPFINPNNEIQVDASSRVICLSDYKRIIQQSGSNGIASVYVNVSDVGYIYIFTHVSFLCAILFVKR